MEHKTVATATKPQTDLGEFEAIAAAWTEDRERDVIHRGAFTGTIRNWRRSGKRIPLHWDHKGDPKSIIGHVDPASMRETDDGLYVKGQVDLENSDLGREAWRLIKSGVVGLSFGYLASQQVKREGGGRDLHSLDVFEVSITPAPMNADTRILSTKGLLPETKVTAEPFSTSRTSNWVARAGGLPPYYQHIAHDLMDSRGMTESRAIATARAICLRWCRGQGNVKADTRAKACAANAEWDRKIASTHARSAGKAVSDPPAAAANSAGDVPTEDLQAICDELFGGDMAAMFEAIIEAMVAAKDRGVALPPPTSVGKSLDSDLRKRAQELELEIVSEGEGLRQDLKAVVAKQERDKVEEIVDARFQAMERNFSALTDQLSEWQRARASAPALRKRALELEHEILTQEFPDEPDEREEPDERDWEVDFRLEAVEKAIGGLTDQIADYQRVRDREPSLRRRAEEMELELASGGQVAPEKVEPKPEKEGEAARLIEGRFAEMKDAIGALTKQLGDYQRVRNEEAELRRKARDMERDIVVERLPKEAPAAKVEPEPEPEPKDERMEAVEKNLGELTKQIADYQRVRSEEPSLRKRAQELELEVVSEGKSKRSERKAKPELKPEPLPQEERLASIETAIKALAQNLGEYAEKIADVAGRRSADPLRDRVRALELEVASGGQSLRSPPPIKPQAPPPRPESEKSYAELKQEAQDLMLIAFSGIEEINE